ncbi:hypothetical protein [Streptomyces sp. AGS-58]|uniref:hypothetical protein n=1 Tax=unclassified Streptomyces TaxID=2593676 RepID=UPI0035A26CE4
MNRATLTERYLERLREQRPGAAELIGRQPELPVLTSDSPGFLARPLFLGHQEREQLTADLEHFRTALLSLPEQLFGGDLAAFARAAGMTEVQISAILRSRQSDHVSRMARADLCVDASGFFKLLECNMSSALGGMENPVMARALLEHPLLAEFAGEHRLAVGDTVRALARTMYAETGYGAGGCPVVAVADFPTSYLNGFHEFVTPFAGLLRDLGVDAHPCHIGEFEYHDGRVWLGERAVDVILRVFINEDVLESPEAPSIMDPVLAAVEAGQVKLFGSMDSEIFNSKAALAMLSDEANRSLFNAEQLAALDRLLPWTRMVRDGEVTLEDGSQADLFAYGIAHQAELVLKPAVSHGGSGVLLGWDENVTAAEWRARLTEALGGPYVLQRRIHPLPEYFPDQHGELQPWLVVWGVFMMADGYAGVLARGSRVDSGVGVVNCANGAFCGTALHELPPV